ncbi:response regulator transcription factor [Roseateles sp. YR242]|uniref:response regulator transcription factor n=1 Tax=Roseateles sp. YR242 TaxID=1855305 RepID=UPI000B87E5F3|nr:response regulator transcription factor [Roseateles sp. YR242]
MTVTRRVLLVDDHELVRAGIRTLYQSLDEISIEWVEASSLQEGLQLYGEQADGQAVDAVLLDLNLGDCKGLQGLRQFMEAYPQARVVVFSGTQDEFVVRQARALGAVGYLPKGALMSEMRSTLRALLAEQRRSGPAGSMFPRFPSSAMYDRVAELGPRHLEILELVLSGCSNQEISNSTQLSLGTVKNYVSSLLLALDVKSRSHMISLFR